MEMNVLPKVKLNMWKVCTKSLPTRVNLNKRTVLESMLCPFCKIEPDKVTHLLR